MSPRPPHVTADDVGSFWLGDDGNVWRIVAYCRDPTVTFARVDAPEIQRDGAVGSHITEGFVRLEPIYPPGHAT